MQKQKFVVDEDLPRSTSRNLADAGYEVFDIRDHGLRGAEDKEIFKFSIRHQATLVTGDLDFGNILQFSLGTHYGIIILNFPSTFSIQGMNRQFLAQLKILSAEEIKGNLILIEPGRVRLKIARHPAAL